MHTHLHMDHARTSFDADMTTPDGLRVRVTSNPDLLGEGGYAGSTLHGVDALCSGLFDDSFEDSAALPRTPEDEDTPHLWSLPHSQRFARGFPPRKPNIEPAKLNRILARKMKAAIPMSRIAEMASALERSHAFAQHEEVLLFGFLTVTVSVERKRQAVVTRSLSGIPANSAGTELAFRFVQEVIDEARDRFWGEIGHA